MTPRTVWLMVSQSGGTYLRPCWRPSGSPNPSSGRDQLCPLQPDINLQSPPGGKGFIMEATESSHPQGKCTTVTLQLHHEALQRGLALLNATYHHPTADLADHTQACWGWGRGNSVHLLFTTNWGPKCSFSERTVQAGMETRGLIQQVFWTHGLLGPHTARAFQRVQGRFEDMSHEVCLH